MNFSLQGYIKTPFIEKEVSKLPSLSNNCIALKSAFENLYETVLLASTISLVH